MNELRLLYICCSRLLDKKKILIWYRSVLISSNNVFSHEEVLSVFQIWYVHYLCYTMKTGLLTTDCPRLSSHIFLPSSWTELAGRRSKYATNGARQHKQSTSLDKTEHTFSDCTQKATVKGCHLTILYSHFIDITHL